MSLTPEHRLDDEHVLQAAADLRTTVAVRERCGQLLARARAGKPMVAPTMPPRPLRMSVSPR